MKRFTPLKTVATVALAATLGTALVGCGSSSSDNKTSASDTSEGVAATVNGENIGEKAITDYIEAFRVSAGLEDETAWGEWLASTNSSPETIRTDVIDYFVDDVLYRQAEKEYNIQVSDEELDQALQETKANYASEESFAAALEAANMNEETYKNEVLRPSLEKEMLATAVLENFDVEAYASSDDQLIAYAQQNADTLRGAKHSKMILFALEDEAIANEVHDKIISGELTFDDAVAQYSIDEETKANAGSMGWDFMGDPDNTYYQMLTELAQGDVTDPVQTENGWVVLTVDDVFDIPEEGLTSLDQIPADIVSYLETAAGDQSISFSDWFAQYKSQASIEIHDMPEGLPYAVDMSQFISEEDQQAEEAAEAVRQAEEEARAQEALGTQKSKGQLTSLAEDRHTINTEGEIPDEGDNADKGDKADKADKSDKKDKADKADKEAPKDDALPVEGENPEPNDPNATAPNVDGEFNNTADDNQEAKEA